MYTKTFRSLLSRRYNPHELARFSPYHWVHEMHAIASSGATSALECGFLLSLVYRFSKPERRQLTRLKVTRNDTSTSEYVQYALIIYAPHNSSKSPLIRQFQNGLRGASFRVAPIFVWCMCCAFFHKYTLLEVGIWGHVFPKNRDWVDSILYLVCYWLRSKNCTLLL